MHLSSVVTAPGCRIPATPCTHLDGLIEYLEGVKCNQLFPIDLALDKLLMTCKFESCSKVISSPKSCETFLAYLEKGRTSCYVNTMDMNGHC